LDKGNTHNFERDLEVNKEELEIQNEVLLATQAKLVKSVEGYAELFDYAPVSYFILDKNGLITNVNYTGCNQLCIYKKELIGRPLSIFLSSKSYQDDYYRHRNLVIETEKLQQLECEIKRNDGSVFFALIESTIVKNENNEFKHFFSAISVISKQKEQEHNLELALIKEKELSEMKSRFVTMASHEFRTPLGTILTSIDLIKKHIENNDPRKCEKHIDRVKSSISNLTEILNDFLSFDKLEHGEIKVIKDTIDIKKFAVHAIEEAELTFKSGQYVEYIHTGNEQISIDPKIFHKIMLNLLSNASKYSGEGKKIELASTVLNGKVIINVKDNGIGIPSKEQGQMFSRLFRAKNAEMVEGTGLGLNIVKKYVELLNGNISFISKENEGSIFTVEIPI